MRAGLLAALRADPAVNRVSLTPPLTEEALADMTLDNILFLLVKQAEDCGALVEVLRRLLGGK